MEQEQNRAIYCTADQTRAVAVVSEGKPTRVECPTCGKTDTLEAAAADAVKGQIGGMLDDVFRGSKSMSVKKSSDAPRWMFGDA